MIFLSLLLSGAASAVPLDSLENAYLALALRKNLSHAADSLDVVSSRETRAGVRSGYGPQGLIEAGLGATNDLDGTSTGQATGSATVSQWVPTGGTAAVALSGSSSAVTDRDRRDSANLMVSFSQPLLKGFGSGASLTWQVRQADAATKMKFHSARGQGLALLQQARNAFWSLTGSVATVQAQAEDSARTERLLQVARVQYQSGSSPALDTLTAATNYARAKVSLLQGRNALRDGVRLLTTLADTDAVALPHPDSLPSPEISTRLPSVDDLLKESLRRAPDLAQAQAKIEALQAETDYRRSARLPRLDGLVYASDALAGTGAPTDWRVGARLDFEWALPNGTDRAKYRTALLDLRSAQLRREASEKELRRQIQRIVDAWETAREQLALSVDLAILQRRRLAASEVSYGVGSTSLMDLQTVRADWMNAVTSSWQSLAQLKALEADLETRTGIGPARQGWIWEEQ